MHPNAALITRFYEAFQVLDADTMVACYHPEVVFSDPVFPNLVGPRAGAMWKMLTGRASDLKVDFSAVQADDRSGSAHWEAHYTWSGTGRPVHNIIEARFDFEEGLIRSHTDSFDLWRWTRQALGATGLLLGWTPMVQNKVRGTAEYGLSRFLEKQGDG